MFLFLVVFNLCARVLGCVDHEWPEGWTERQTFWARKILTHLPEDDRAACVQSLTWRDDAHPISSLCLHFLLMDLDKGLSFIQRLSEPEMKDGIEEGYTPTSCDIFLGQIFNVLNDLKTVLPQKFCQNPPKDLSAFEEVAWWQSNQKNDMALCLRDFLFQTPSEPCLKRIKALLLQSPSFFRSEEFSFWWDRETNPLLLNHFFHETRCLIEKEYQELLAFVPEERPHGVDEHLIAHIKQFAKAYQQAKSQPTHMDMSLIFAIFTKFNFTLCHIDCINIMHFCFDDAAYPEGTPLADRVELLTQLNNIPIKPYKDFQPQLLWPICQISRFVDVLEYPDLASYYACDALENKASLRRVVSLSIVSALLEHGFKKRWKSEWLFEWIATQEIFFERRTGCCTSSLNAYPTKAECILSSVLSADMWEIRNARKNPQLFHQVNCFNKQTKLCLTMKSLQSDLYFMPPDAPDIFRELRLHWCSYPPNMDIPLFFHQKNRFTMWRVMAGYVKKHGISPTLSEWEHELNDMFQGVPIPSYAKLDRIHERVLFGYQAGDARGEEFEVELAT